VSIYETEPAGAKVLVLHDAGVCPPHGAVVHICAKAVPHVLFAWFDKQALIDKDGDCRFCGERV
jgi:hypothetical protein